MRSPAPNNVAGSRSRVQRFDYPYSLPRNKCTRQRLDCKRPVGPDSVTAFDRPRASSVGRFRWRGQTGPPGTNRKDASSLRLPRNLHRIARLRLALKARDLEPPLRKESFGGRNTLANPKAHQAVAHAQNAKQSFNDARQPRSLEYCQTCPSIAENHIKFIRVRTEAARKATFRVRSGPTAAFPGRVTPQMSDRPSSTVPLCRDTVAVWSATSYLKGAF